MCALFFLLFPAEVRGDVATSETEKPVRLNLYDAMTTARYWPASRKDYPSHKGVLNKAVDRNGVGSKPGADAHNGMIDWAEFAVIEAIYNDSTSPLHREVRTVWDKNLKRATNDLRWLQPLLDSGYVPGTIKDWAQLVAAYFTLGDNDSAGYIERVMGELSVFVFRLNYDRSLAPRLSSTGDVDRDGLSNKAEYDKCYTNKTRESFTKKESINKYLGVTLDGFKRTTAQSNEKGDSKEELKL